MGGGDNSVTPKYVIEDSNPDNWKQGEEHDLTVKRTYPVILDGNILLEITCEGGDLDKDELIDDGSKDWGGEIKVIPNNDNIKITIKSEDTDIELEEEFVQEEIETTELNTNGYDYIDMGEAGIWATCNVGASKPEEEGLYFAWGEIEPKEIREGTWDNYKFGTEDNITKYNSFDNITILELEDDAAHINMGGNWRMPLKEEFDRLINLCNTEWTTNYKETGLSGTIFKLKTNESKQLFFRELTNGNGCQYWSSQLYNSSKTTGYAMYGFEHAVIASINKLRYIEIGVRAIYDPSISNEEPTPETPNNEIWYTTINNQPIDDSRFITNTEVVSNDFDKSINKFRVSFKDNVTSIGTGFLCGISNVLESINLNGLSQVTSIEDYFLERTTLESIDLSSFSKLNSIGYGFLMSSYSLKLINLSGLSQVTSIGNNFLSSCIDLKIFIIDHPEGLITLPLEKSSITPDNIYVNDELIEQYKEALPNFANKFKPLSEYNS